ncbi:hypothetical protein ACHAXR_001669 [Thalassiosira sp. AJA248-18]
MTSIWHSFAEHWLRPVKGAFEYTGEASVPKYVTRVKFLPAVTEVGEETFSGCDELKEVELNEGLLKIGIRAFSGCESLDSIRFPSTITEVGEEAFSSCDRLKEVELNEGLLKIGEGAFYSCPSLHSIRFSSTITEVGEEAFYRCTELKEVELNEGLRRVGAGAFDPFLESVKFPCISRRLGVLIQNSHAEIENKINEIPGAEWRGGEMLISFEQTERDDWKSTRDRFLGVTTYYELKEATNIFELALWKAKISAKSAGTYEACRVEVPGPVKGAVLQFFSYNRV